MSVRLIIAGVACGTVLLTLAMRAQDAADLKRGEALMVRHCSACHAVGRTGASPRPDALPLRTLARRYPVESLEESLGEGMVAGHSDMPEIKFSPADVGAVIAYLKSIQEP
jgi:mono/diheme cytochrome c family protein